MEVRPFQAESRRLLDLMINSIYTHKEIFLREIISNASDAIDKLAYQALTDDKVGLNRDDFAITLKADEQYRLLTVSDNGIGMSRDEMEQNLGTIAKSGTLAFRQKLDEGADVDVIGQFGVGFYSAFMVSEAITVISRKYGSDEAWMWQSSGAEGYTISPCEKDRPGTDVIMKLKIDTEDEDYSQFLKTYRLKSLVRKYSDYVRYPIRMDVEKTRSVKKEETEDGKDEYETETYTETETFNSMTPIWQRPKSELAEEDYSNFYQDKFGDYEEPAAYIHISAEGKVTYKALLFIPARAPYDFYTREYEKGLQLYSSGVMIMDKCADLLPDHFRFVRGVVDSSDLSLNISREMLQHDRQLKLIAGNLEKKIKSELEKLMQSDREKYESFFKAFGLQLKYGAVSDYGAHKETVQDLLLFYSAREDRLVSLHEYVEAMPEDQKDIYYVAGENRTRLAQLPQTEMVRDKGYDILYFTDDVDEFVAQTLMKYEDKEFKNVATQDLNLQTDEDKQKADAEQQEAKDVLEFVKTTLGGKVKEVRLSQNLKSHPVVLTPDPTSGLSFEMEKYLNKVTPDGALKADRILELNAAHPVFEALRQAIQDAPEKAKQYAELLYCQALLIADLPLDDPTTYTDLVCSLMK